MMSDAYSPSLYALFTRTRSMQTWYRSAGLLQKYTAFNDGIWHIMKTTKDVNDLIRLAEIFDEVDVSVYGPSADVEKYCTLCPLARMIHGGLDLTGCMKIIARFPPRHEISATSARRISHCILDRDMFELVPALVAHGFVLDVAHCTRKFIRQAADIYWPGGSNHWPGGPTWPSFAANLVYCGRGFNPEQYFTSCVHMMTTVPGAIRSGTAETQLGMWWREMLLVNDWGKDILMNALFSLGGHEPRRVYRWAVRIDKHGGVMRTRNCQDALSPFQCVVFNGDERLIMKYVGACGSFGRYLSDLRDLPYDPDVDVSVKFARQAVLTEAKLLLDRIFKRLTPDLQARIRKALLLQQVLHKYHAARQLPVEIWLLVIQLMRA